MEIESAEDMPFAISATFDRIVYPPRGRAGGKNGTTGRVETCSGQQPAAQGAIEPSPSASA